MKTALLIIAIMIGSISSGYTATPAKQAPKAEAKFIPEMTYRSWEKKYRILKNQVDELNGSKPIREIRKQIEKELKQTQKLMKQLNRLDARKVIEQDDLQKYLNDTTAINNRLTALTQNLTLAVVPSDVSPKKREKWNTSRKAVLEQLQQIGRTLKDTEESLKKLKINP